MPAGRHSCADGTVPRKRGIYRRVIEKEVGFAMDIKDADFGAERILKDTGFR